MAKFFRNLLKLAIGGTAALTVAVKPRTDRKNELEEFVRYDFAHGGFTGGDAMADPCSIEAVNAAIERGYGLALDVRMDSLSKPVIAQDVVAPGASALSLRACLEEIAGQVPILLYLRPDGEQIERFCSHLFPLLDAYEGVFALMSADPKLLRYLRENREEFIRGHYVDPRHVEEESVKSVAKGIASANLLFNLWTAPDFIACEVCDRNRFPIRLCRLVYRVNLFNLGVRTMEDYELVKTDGATVVFSEMEP